MLRKICGHTVQTPINGDVIDVGCYPFDFSEQAARLCAGSVYGFDLGPCVYPPYGVRFARCAVRSTGGIARYRSPDKRTAWHLASDGDLIPAVTVEQIVRDCDVRRGSLLKLDCEGAELGILCPQCEIPKQITQISVEFHLHLWPELEYMVDSIIDAMSEWEIVQHDKTQRRPGEPANYWDTLLVRRC